MKRKLNDDSMVRVIYPESKKEIPHHELLNGIESGRIPTHTLVCYLDDEQSGHTRLVWCLLQFRRMSEAVDEFRKALQFDPLNPEVKMLLIETLNILGRHTEAQVVNDQRTDALVQEIGDRIDRLLQQK